MVYHEESDTAVKACGSQLSVKQYNSLIMGSAAEKAVLPFVWLEKFRFIYN